LPTLDMQRTFLNQLAMVLFSWIKKHPNPPGRALRGLLVVDEAKDFLPAQKATECKESMLRLGAQARKYGLGLVFATQHPKDIEHKLVGNSATHFYGLNNSPASLATLKEQMQLKGGSGDDIARLKVGQFYFHSAGAAQVSPVKVKVPDCLSNKRLLEEQEILAKARRSRASVEGRE
jgi:DNA helicase HerA-like ATPase